MARTRWLKGRFVIPALAVALLLVAAVWWWTGRSDPPTPVNVTCENAPLPEPGPDAAGSVVPSAPTAVAARPVPGEPQPPREIDLVPLSQHHQVGALEYQLDPAAATVTQLRADGDPAGPEWTRVVHSGQLRDDAIIGGMPGRVDLLRVVGRLRDSDTDLLVAAVDTAGAFHLSCVASGVPDVDELAPPTLTPDGAVLLVPNLDEAGVEWVEAHATDSGEHVWSAPAVAFTADEQRVYLATGSTLSAREAGSGDRVWEREAATDFADTGYAQAGGAAWSLAAVGGELYAYRHDGVRLLALNASNGEVVSDLVSARRDSSRLRITPLDDDRVLVEWDADLAVRNRPSQEWRWLHRGVEGLPLLAVLAREGEPVSIAVRPDPYRVTLLTGSGSVLADLALPGDDHAVAVADTMVYALNLDEGTVTGYDLAASEPVWTMSVPVDDGVEAIGIEAFDEGFRVWLDTREYVPFTAE